MTNPCDNENPFDSILAAVKRPTAPASQAFFDGAEPAAEAKHLPASAAFFSQMTESDPLAARADTTAPARASSATGAVTLQVELSPAVALILSLSASAKSISTNEAISRAICVFAETIGIPSLVTEIDADGGARHANRFFEDLHAVPAFKRGGTSRFKR
ncbi:hypothetical protein [Mesorhizobium sp.]|uniref:hypothetical protein n=1 Tax=Mesorhizobium sp. TaxID=1871066 RepID=UPI000FE8CBCF|nr:hypothetical protein [Mesorhizobium sp.]RWO90891.1 MAG: hypothetical protein EOQ95_13525 [Mesorhizobium sp.]